MYDLQKLREKREAKAKEARKLLDTATAASRSLTAEETTQFDGLMAEVRSIAADITRAEGLEAAEAEAAGTTPPLNTHSTSEARALAS